MTKKSVIFLERTPVFLPKRVVFLKRYLQVAAVVMVKNEAKRSREWEVEIGCFLLRRGVGFASLDARKDSAVLGTETGESD
jgi:hypothetical protein